MEVPLISIPAGLNRNAISMMFSTVIAVKFYSAFPVEKMTLSIGETLLEMKCQWQNSPHLRKVTEIRQMFPC